MPRQTTSRARFTKAVNVTAETHQRLMDEALRRVLGPALLADHLLAKALDDLEADRNVPETTEATS